MMGIIVPEGESQITLEFHTPGLVAGIAVSVAATLCLAGITLVKNIRQKAGKRNAAVR